MKNIFRQHFIIFTRNMPKLISTRSQKNYYQYFMKSFRAVPERHQESPWTIVQSSCEKYFSTKFHHFCAKYFSSFEMFAPLLVLRSVPGFFYPRFEKLGPIPGSILSPVFSIPGFFYPLFYSYTLFSADTPRDTPRHHTGAVNLSTRRRQPKNPSAD